MRDLSHFVHALKLLSPECEAQFNIRRPTNITVLIRNQTTILQLPQKEKVTILNLITLKPREKSLEIK